MSSWLQTIEEDRSTRFRPPHNTDTDGARSALSGGASSLNADVGSGQASAPSDQTGNSQRSDAQAKRRWQLSWNQPRAASSDGGIEVGVANGSPSSDLLAASVYDAQAPRMGSRTAVSVAAGSDTNAMLGGQNATSEAPSEQSPHQASDDGNAPANRCGSQNPAMRRFAIVVAVLVVLAIAAIIVGVALDDGDSTGASKIDVGVTQSEKPTMAASVQAPTAAPVEVAPTLPPFDWPQDSEMPTIQPTRNDQFLQLLDGIIDAISNEDSLRSPTSPQSQCKEWLINLDGMDNSAQNLRQRYVLCVLYATTGGDVLDASSGTWEIPFLDVASSECTWEGIVCDNGTIAAIGLESMGLVGSIPEEILSLTDLGFVGLKNNSINASLPPNLFASFPKLLWFDVSDNSIGGQIPKLPETAVEPLTNASQYGLSHLILNNNSFTGTLPYFPHIEEVWVRYNALEGFDERYTESQTMTTFIGYNNAMSGPLHSDWDTPNLSILDLSRNQLGGQLPESLWDLEKLTFLSLHQNLFEGQLRAGRKGKAIERCWLHSNKLSGKIPDNFAKAWTNLTKMELHNNKLTGSITQEQCDAWQKLEVLAVDCNTEPPAVSCACCTACSDERTSPDEGRKNDTITGDGASRNASNTP